jgi:hypothetical protein
LEAFLAASCDLEATTNRTLNLECRDTHVAAFLFSIQ